MCTILYASFLRTQQLDRPTKTIDRDRLINTTELKLKYYNSTSGKYVNTFISEKKYFVVTFVGSIVWIALYSYLMVWWATVTGDVIGIPDQVK